jgi:hypothetical protein
MPAAYLAPPRPISLHAVLDASSSAGTVPTIDLEWEPFHAHVEAFLNAIDQYTMDAKTEIARRASEHVDMVRDMKVEKEEVERRITLEREREAVMLASEYRQWDWNWGLSSHPASYRTERKIALEQERHTVGDLSSSLARLQQTLSKTKEQSAAVEAELNAVRKEVKAERGEKERQGKVLEQQRGRDAIELQILQEVLGLRIEGVKGELYPASYTCETLGGRRRIEADFHSRRVAHAIHSPRPFRPRARVLHDHRRVQARVHRYVTSIPGLTAPPLGYRLTSS